MVASLLISGALLLGEVEGASSAKMPPVECVRVLRSARVAADRKDDESAREQLLGAVELPGCEVPALADFFGAGYSRGTDDETEAMRQRLADRVGDPRFDLAPGMADYLVSTTKDREEQQRLRVALERRLGGIQGSSAEVLRSLVALQTRLGMTAEASDTLSRLLDVAPSTDLEWRALQLDRDEGNWPRVAARSQDLLSRSAGDPAAVEYLRRTRLIALAHLGRFDDLQRLIDDLEGSVGSGEEAPHGALGALLLRAAWAFRDGGHDEEAEVLFRQIASGGPQSDAAREAKSALVYLYSTEAERAELQTRAAERRARETDPQALYEEGSELLATGDAVAAFDLLDRAAPQLNETPFAEAAWYNLGIAAFRLEKWDRVVSALTEAIALEPSRAPSYRQRGLALVHLKRCPEAVEMLEKSLGLEPGQTDLYYYLARCYEEVGRTDDAAAATERYQSGSGR